MSKPSLLLCDSGQRCVQLERPAEDSRKTDHERNTKNPTSSGRQARGSPGLVHGRQWRPRFWLEFNLDKMMHLSTSLEHCLDKVTVVMEVNVDGYSKTIYNIEQFSY